MGGMDKAPPSLGSVLAYVILGTATAAFVVFAAVGLIAFVQWAL